jgi:hypothetical protein
MKIICPHCDFVINLSGNQVHKALEALAKMPKEKTLKLKCTVCKKNIDLKPELFSQKIPETLPSTQTDEKSKVVTDRIESEFKDDNRLPVYEFKKIYIQVDSIHEGEKLVESFDISPLQELGKSGWDIVTVVPRTFSETFRTKEEASLSKNLVFGAACGGNIMGVYFILRRCIV